MAFAGFLLFFDPPKPDAQRTIRDLTKLGIRIKIISGDNRYVTAHLAEAVGLDPKSMLTGEELAKLKDEALWHLAPRTDLFVEVDPQQKERIVRALQKMGHAVGYLGDGINDAPALHAADVGISVDQAVDVARESADIILLKRDLDVLRRGVEDGRRTFANTLKYICITTSANFGNMVSMALATPLLPFLPLAAKQILLNNFLSDLPSIAISTDNVDPETVTRAQRWHIKDVQRFMIVFGLISSVFDLLTFATLAACLSCQRSDFPDHLVRHFALDRARRCPRPSNAPARVPQQAEPLAVVVHYRCEHRRPRDPLPRVACLGVRFCAIVRARDGGRARHRRWLHRSDRSGEGMVLSNQKAEALRWLTQCIPDDWTPYPSCQLLALSGPTPSIVVMSANDPLRTYESSRKPDRSRQRLARLAYTARHRTDHPPSQTARPHPGDKEGMAFGSTITGSDYVPGLLGSFRSVRLFTVWAQAATEAPHSLLFQRLQVSHTTCRG